MAVESLRRRDTGKRAHGRLTSRGYLVGAALVASLGCSPPAMSLRGLSASEADVVSDPRIEGEWILLNPDFMTSERNSAPWYRLRVHPGDDGHYLVEAREATPDNGGSPQEIGTYSVSLVSLNHRLFFDGTFNDAQFGEYKSEGFFGLAPLHILGNVAIEDEMLVVSVPESEWLRKHAPVTPAESLGQSRRDLTILTGSTDALRTFMAFNADRFSGDLSYVYLCRPDADCAARAVEDTLARTPEETRMLERAAGFYFRRRNYGRTVELRRRQVERAPNDAFYRSELGDALLFTRDFESAKKEFAIAERLAVPSTQRIAARDGVAWAYFFEGRFAEAALASTPNAPDRGRSVDTILLHYFALQRSMRQAEAAAFLDAQTRTFTGSVADQVLVVEMQRCVAACVAVPWSFSEEQEHRFRFFRSQLALVKGDTLSAREQLETLAGSAAANRFGLAATIELERLVTMSRVRRNDVAAMAVPWPGGWLSVRAP